MNEWILFTIGIFIGGMVGDTMTLTADWFGGNLDFYIVLD